MTVQKTYRVSEKFDKSFQDIQRYLKDVCGLSYTQADMLDEMMELYDARIRFDSNILNELFREHDEAILQQFLISNAEMLNAVKEMIMEAKR